MILKRREFLGKLAGLLIGASAGCDYRSQGITNPGVAPAGQRLGNLSAERVLVGGSGPDTLDESAASPETPQPAESTLGTADGVKPPDLIVREAWGASPAAGAFWQHEPRWVTVHHTGTVWQGGDAAAHVRAIQAFHQGPTRKWPDIAYHYLVDQEGSIYIGRPENAVPDTASNYDPSGHLTLCLLGNFEVQRPTDAQIASLANLIAWMVARHELPLSALGGHRDYAATLCPGHHLHSFLRDGALEYCVVSRMAGAAP